jgi:L-ribulokinase
VKGGHIVDKYVIGLDFGTLSARALLVNVVNGQEVATAVSEYKHGVIQDYLPGSNTKLEDDWALQDPNDYLEAIYEIIPKVIREGYVKSEDIIGIGIDFTSCTILPIDKNGDPLCNKEEFRHDPHSWVKLWKHHAAQYEADKLNEIAEKRNEPFLNLYGGKISSEWLIPKVMQIVDESPKIYDAAYTFIEAGDWIVFKLTGVLNRNCCAAGFKAMWNDKLGFPSNEFLRELNPTLENFVELKIKGEVVPIGARAGFLTKEMSNKLGLTENTAVAVASVDAHVAFPAVGANKKGDMVLIIGTSTCNITISDKEVLIPGISGVVKDSVIPGYYGYEAGQPAVGDIFDWYVKNCVPYNYYVEAQRKNLDIFDYLNQKASKLKPGDSGLICLDWFNGNRSTLVDANLSGLILGLTLSTKPEEIYRSLIEATAFGQKIIIDIFNEYGVTIDNLYACGGIAVKNPLLMQIYADVLGINIKVSSSDQAVALGSAILGAVAAGSKNDGYDSIEEASKFMSVPFIKEYVPNKEYTEMYMDIFEEYRKLYNYFGKTNGVMKKLKNKSI